MSATAGSGGSVTVEVAGRTLQLSNLDKVLWPEAGLSKRWLLSYYADVAGTILPHLAERPLTLHRFPDGVDGSHWYQTRAPAHPPWVRTVRLHYPRTGKTFDACVVSDAATLLWAANLGAVELHPFLARTDALDRPTALVFDLDPAGRQRSSTARASLFGSGISSLSSASLHSSRPQERRACTSTYPSTDRTRTIRRKPSPTPSPRRSRATSRSWSSTE